MLRVLHSVSAFCFYLLGLTFFGAYLLVQNDAGGAMPSLWLRIADLPFLLTGLVYGGISLVLSFGNASRTRRVIGWIVAIPLTAVFAYFALKVFVFA